MLRVLTLACLAGAGYGRRVQASDELRRRALTKGRMRLIGPAAMPGLQWQLPINQMSRRTLQEGASDSLRVLGNFLRALHPAAAFDPGALHTGTAIRAHSLSSRSANRPLMQLKRRQKTPEEPRPDWDHRTGVATTWGSHDDKVRHDFMNWVASGKNYNEGDWEPNKPDEEWYADLEEILGGAAAKDRRPLFVNLGMFPNRLGMSEPLEEAYRYWLDHTEYEESAIRGAFNLVPVEEFSLEELWEQATPITAEEMARSAAEDAALREKAKIAKKAAEAKARKEAEARGEVTTTEQAEVSESDEEVSESDEEQTDVEAAAEADSHTNSTDAAAANDTNDTNTTGQKGLLPKPAIFTQMGVNFTSVDKFYPFELRMQEVPMQFHSGQLIYFNAENWAAARAWVEKDIVAKIGGYGVRQLHKWERWQEDKLNVHPRTGEPGEMVESIPYIVHRLHRTDAGDQLEELRESHLDFLREGDRVTMGGPLFEDDSGEDKDVGSMLIVWGDDLEEVRNWTNKDPYHIAGLFASVTVAPLHSLFVKDNLFDLFGPRHGWHRSPIPETTTTTTLWYWEEDQFIGPQPFRTPCGRWIYGDQWIAENLAGNFDENPADTNHIQPIHMNPYLDEQRNTLAGNFRQNLNWKATKAQIDGVAFNWPTDDWHTEEIHEKRRLQKQKGQPVAFWNGFEWVARQAMHDDFWK